MNAPIVLVSCYDDGSWYAIERADGTRLQWASIEGDAEEMLAIADAIERRGSVAFKRCAVHVDVVGRVLMHSPRNSVDQTVITLADADALARSIRECIAAGRAESCAGKEGA